MTEDRPHIGLTLEWAGTEAGGIEVYAKSLVSALAARGGLRLTAYTARPGAMEGISGLDARFLGTRSRAAFHGAFLPWELLRRPPDLLHVTSIPPLVSPVPFVMTLHDMGHRVMPDMYPPRIRWRLDRTITSGLRRARRIVCISEATRRDLLDHHPEVSEDRIDVIGEGSLLDPRPAAPAADGAVRARYGLRDGYFHYVGRLHVRKNLVRLIDAFAALPADVRAAHPLVLTGREMYGEGEVAARIAHHGLGDLVRMTGHVPDADLPALMRGALAFVYPSLFEGFGLPPLEAMALGVPVIVSDAHSLPEVVGDAGLQVDATEAASLAGAMLRLAGDPALRETLSARGRARAERFTWSRTADRMARTYMRALDSAPVHAERGPTAGAT